MRSIKKKVTIYCFLSLIAIGCVSTNDNAKDFGISIRQEPLRDFITNKSVRVSDFGALPNDDKIDTKAIQQAIDEAKQLKDKVKKVMHISVDHGEVIQEALDIDHTSFEDAKSALLALGYSHTEINKAVSSIETTNLSTEDIIKLALKNLMNR